MFKSIREAVDGTYCKGSDDSVQLANVQEKTTKLGTATLPESVHVQILNNTLYLVGQVCNQGKVVVFTAGEGEILEISRFTVDQKDVIEVAKINKSTGLYQLPNNTSTSSHVHSSLTLCNITEDRNIWHNRLIHVNKNSFRTLSRYTKNVPVMTGNLSTCHP